MPTAGGVSRCAAAPWNPSARNDLRLDGRPDDAKMQRRILLDALHLAESAREGGTLIDLPYEWGEPFGTTVDRMAGAMTS